MSDCTFLDAWFEEDRKSEVENLYQGVTFYLKFYQNQSCRQNQSCQIK